MKGENVVENCVKLNSEWIEWKHVSTNICVPEVGKIELVAKKKWNLGKMKTENIKERKNKKNQRSEILKGNKCK